MVKVRSGKSGPKEAVYRQGWPLDETVAQMRALMLQAVMGMVKQLQMVGKPQLAGWCGGCNRQTLDSNFINMN